MKSCFILNYEYYQVFNGLRVYEYLEHLLDTIYRTPKNLLDLNKLLPWSQKMQAAFRME